MMHPFTRPLQVGGFMAFVLAFFLVDALSHVWHPYLLVSAFAWVAGVEFGGQGMTLFLRRRRWK